MHSRTLLLVFVFVFEFVSIKSFENRDYIRKAFERVNGFNGFNDIKEWRETYKKNLLDLLDALPKDVKDYLISKADKSNRSEWKSKLATQYLEYLTTGNRDNYETINTQRRAQLVNLVIGELVTKNGTYLDQICNGLWLIMEESSWQTPEDLGKMQKAGPGLPDPEEDVLDIRAAEMSSTVSLIKLVLKEELNSVNQMFVKRIDYELNKRIVYPYLHNNDLFWLGFNENETWVNNHNTWCNSNILRTALLAIDDELTRNQIINRSITSVDVYLNQRPEDGGSDEGPGYWEWAGGRLIEYFDLLTSVTNGGMNWSDKELIHRIGSYIYKVHIAEDKYVNFADSHSRVDPEANSVYKYGKLFNDNTLKSFASFVANNTHYLSIETVSDFWGSFSTFTANLQTYAEIKKIEPKAPFPKKFYFDGIQVVISRSVEGSTKGLFLAAKGGTNDESHNHNDLGNFIIYINGNPFIIDIGVGVYTNVTFSPDRYTIFSMQSQWHNCPTINGVQQKDGKQFIASNVSYSSTEDSIAFSADIAQAYPKEAEVESYVRTIEFNQKTNKIQVHDQYVLKRWIQPLKVHFVSHLKPQQNKAIVKFADRGSELSMTFDSNQFTAEMDNKVIDKDDYVLRESWGDFINRVTLKQMYDMNQLKGEFTTFFEISRN